MDSKLYSALSILKATANIGDMNTSSEQIAQTKEYFFKTYSGENPLVAEAADLNVFTQVDIATKNITYLSFLSIAEKKSEINLAEYSYLGFSRDKLKALLQTIITTDDFKTEDKIQYISTFSSIVDTLNVCLVKTTLLCLIIMFEYDSFIAVKAIAYYLYISTALEVM